MVSSSTGNDPNWYLDSGAMDHITGELKRLTMHDHYMSHMLISNLCPFIDLILTITRSLNWRWPLSSTTSASFAMQKLILSTIKPSTDRWHLHLGHLARDIVLRVIHDNNLSCSVLGSKEYVCDACLHGKAHQLPYPVSSSHSSTPLDLIFQMFGVRLWTLLDTRNIMLRSLMILVSLHGFTFFVIIPKFLNSLRNFILLLNAGLIGRLLLSNQIGEERV
jgi:hypothetical protein